MFVFVVEDDDECDSMTCVSHRAAYNGDLPQLETLLEAGILSLDHHDQLGSTLLHKGYCQHVSFKPILACSVQYMHTGFCFVF